MSLLDNLPHKCKIQRRDQTASPLGGNRVTRTVEQENVACWEQTANTSEVEKFGKMGIRVTTKIYFTTDPGVTDRHEILVTERNGVTVASPVRLQVLQPAYPDASVGLGLLYRVMGSYTPAQDI